MRKETAEFHWSFKAIWFLNYADVLFKTIFKWSFSRRTRWNRASLQSKVCCKSKLTSSSKCSRQNRKEFGSKSQGYSTLQLSSAQFSSVAQSCPTLCDPMNRSTPGLPVHHQLPESTQTHVHRVDDAIQPSHPRSSPSPPALNLSQHQGLFQWVSSSHQVAKVLEFQLQHQSFQWTPRTDLL